MKHELKILSVTCVFLCCGRILLKQTQMQQSFKILILLLTEFAEFNYNLLKLVKTFMGISIIVIFSHLTMWDVLYILPQFYNGSLREHIWKHK